MKKRFCILLILLLGLVTQGITALNFHVLDVKANLADNYIQDILHDKYGFMWFATRNGLSRYDGYHFRNYTTLQLGSYDNNIEWVKEDASGTIWLKTPVNYCFYNRESDKLDNVLQGPLEKLGIPGVPKQLFIDEDKNLWCVVDNTLYNYRFGQKELLQLSLPRNAGIIDLTCRSLSAYLLLTDGHIVSIDWGVNAIRRVIQAEIHTAFQPYIYLDAASHIWVYNSHSPDIACYSMKENNWVSFVGQDALKQSNATITTVIDDGKGRIWIGTDNRGVFICHYKERNYTWLCKEVNKFYSLPSNHITAIFKSSQDIMWIGTGKQGIAYTCLSHITFENKRCPQQEDVSCLLEDETGDLWLGFDGEGIAHYNKKSDRYTYFKSKEGGTPSDLIVCSYRDSKGRIWFGSFGGGAFYYANGTFYRLQQISQGNLDAPSYVRRITEDRYGNLWFGTFTQGVFCLDAAGDLSVYNTGNSALLTNYIADVAYANDDNLYVATSSGIYKIELSTMNLAQIQSDVNGRRMIQDDFANCIYQDSRGLIWIGGRKGINIYNPTENRLFQLSVDMGISHPFIRAFIEDDKKNMWISTDHGITHVVIDEAFLGDQRGYHCYPYFEQDGIARFTFNNFSIACTKNQKILIGGAGGYLQIATTESTPYYYDQKVIFTELYLANERVNVGEPISDGRILLAKNIQLSTKIELDYSDSNFAIELSAMDYGQLHKLYYLYRLDEKEEWIKLEGNRIYFNKLAPGEYRLQVKVNESLDANESHISTLVIRVAPPFWRSPIAYFLYVVCLMLLLALILLRIKRNHQRILIQQRYEMEVAHQHEVDEAKLRFFTNVNHDLRTPLSLIIIPLEKILHSDAAAGVRNELKLIHRNALTLLNVVNQLLDLRKLENGKAKLHASHGDLVEFVKGVCTSFESYADKKNITLNLSFKDSVLETNFDRNKVERILLNLLSNAFKYNRESGSVTVTLDSVTLEDAPYASIQVIDTGMGISDANKEKIFDRFFQEEYASTAYVGSGVGMHIVKEYVELHKGHIDIRDNVPYGTIVEVRIPILSGVIEISLENQTIEEESVELTETKQVSLLIVEDNDDFRHFLVSCLKEHYQVFEAAHGKEALEVLKQHEIRLVVSDIRMPVMDGLQLCHEIKNDIRYSHIPILLLTARSSEEHVLEGLREDADDYLTKPFNLDILLLRIAKLLQWSSNNHKQFATLDVSPKEITVSTLDEKLIEQAIQAVEDNMDNSEFSVEELSAIICMSRGHLYKKLMTITGKSPIEFIRVLRIKRGKYLLEQSQESISQIAYKVGLSPKSFSKYFKEEFGCLPSEHVKKAS
ncbi:MAG: hybrid sensor histidine kinase/response regulator transcription factor [Phocaeicola sp.]